MATTRRIFDGSKSWYDASGQTFYEKHIYIKFMGDIQPFWKTEGLSNPQFPNCESLCVYACDKNFVYYWITKSQFPKLKTLYLCSHPCQSDWMQRTESWVSNFHVIDHHANYVRRWANDPSNIHLVSRDEINEIIRREFENPTP